MVVCRAPLLGQPIAHAVLALEQTPHHHDLDRG
jgi:hypothetical protein